jgi:DNA polymerase-4
VPLRYLFVDMNAYFASVEQQDHPSLRGKPVGVVPVKAASTCCIAISYEAKRFGVKGGMPVWEARKLCPDIVLALARPERYVEIHHQMVEAVGQCVPVSQVMSIDEVSCRLIGDERTVAKAAEMARGIKAGVRRIGDYLRCSVGVGPNVMLSKVAADMQKPDGFTAIDPADLPGRLHSLELTDFPGIGRQMEARLHRHGITTVEQLTQLTAPQLSRVWGSKVHGLGWWYRLRGDDVPEKPTKRRTIGHGHVLPPELRTPEKAWGVMVRLVHKAAARLRKVNYWAGQVIVTVSGGEGERYAFARPVAPCQDTFTLLQAAAEGWTACPPGKPFKIGVVFADLVPAEAATPSLFPHDRQMNTLSHAMDRVNKAFGPNSVYLGSMFGRTQNAPMRIAFTHIPDEETESVDQLRGYGW